MIPDRNGPEARAASRPAAEPTDEDEPLFRLPPRVRALLERARPAFVIAKKILPFALFFATVVSVLHVGGEAVLEKAAETARFGVIVAAGWQFALSLMSILLAHEFGHYIAAKIHRVPASLPHFLPMPYSPLGTWGAVISMPSRIASRRALLDIGAAGPLAGMAVAVPLLLYGLTLSKVEPMAPHGTLEGQCLLYWILKRVALGRFIPDGYDVFLHPIAFAGWAGLFVTMINLVPVGQLDGGHIAYALLGPRQNKISRVVRNLLLPLFLYNLGKNLLAVRGVPFTREVRDQVVANSLFWLLWFVMLGLLARMSGDGHPPTDEGETLDGPRKVIAVACLVLFVLLFMPAPFTQM